MINKFNKSVCLIMCICIIMGSYLSVGLALAHLNHNCSEHQSEHGCKFCLQIKSILKSYEKLVVISLCSGAFVIVTYVDSSNMLVDMVECPKATPVTLKVKMSH